MQSYEFISYIETSKTDYLLYEAANLLKLGIIREWDQLGTQDILQLRAFIMQYLVDNFTKPAFMREMLSQVSSANGVPAGGRSFLPMRGQFN